jgi:hypothetical protein
MFLLYVFVLLKTLHAGVVNTVSKCPAGNHTRSYIYNSFHAAETWAGAQIRSSNLQCRKDYGRRTS